MVLYILGRGFLCSGIMIMVGYSASWLEKQWLEQQALWLPGG
jgi:hypothetical protein